MPLKARRDAARSVDPARPRATAAIGLTVAMAYIAWRTTTLGSGWTLVLSVPLFFAEVWALTQLALLAFQAWRVPQAQPPKPDTDRTTPVDVAVTAQGSTLESVERSLVGCEGLGGPTRLWVLDADHREDVKVLAQTFNARYISGAPTPDHAIESIVSTGLPEFLVWLEAGQIPMPALVEATFPTFENHNVATVQVGVELLNADSLSHMRRGRDADALTREVAGPATSGRGAAPWFGPGSVIRCSALTAVGGLRVGQRAPVQQALMLLHRDQWETVYESRPLIRSTAPDALSEYLNRRRNEALSIVGVLRTTNSPLRLPGLSLETRLVHFAQLAGFGSGLRQLIYVGVASAALITGRLPFRSPLAQIVSFWCLAAAAQALARWSLARGTMGVGDWVRQGWRTLGAEASALAMLLGLTPKSRAISGTRHGPGVLGQLRMLTTAVVILDLAVLARATTLINPGLLPAFTTGQRVAVLTFGLVITAPMIDVLQVVVRRLQRRSEYRVQAALQIVVGDQTAETLDITPKGVGVAMEHAPPAGKVVQFTLHLPLANGTAIDISGTMTNRGAHRLDKGMVRAGFEFTHLSRDSRVALIRYCTIHHEALGERRSDSRLQAALDATIAGMPSRTLDLTPNGVGVAMYHAPPIGERVHFSLTLPRPDGSLVRVGGWAWTRAATLMTNGLVRVGLEFDTPNAATRAALIRYCAVDHAELGEQAGEVISVPADLAVPRQPRTTRALRVLTAIVAVGGAATVFFGPTAGAAHAEAQGATVCLVDSSGAPLPGAAARIRTTEGGWVDLGTTGPTGCLNALASGSKAEIQVTHRGVTVTTTQDLDDSPTVSFATKARIVRLLGPDGTPIVGAQVRYFLDEWIVAGTTDSKGEVLLELLPTDASYEVLWDGGRINQFRPAQDTSEVTIVMARLRAEDGVTVAEVDQGTGWEPFSDAMLVLPGRLAFRLSDGSVAKLEVPAGNELWVPSGVLVELFVAPTPTPPLTEPTPSTPVEIDPSESVEVAPTPEPTSTTGPTTPPTTPPEPTATQQPLATTQPSAAEEPPPTATPPEPTATSEPDTTATPTEPTPTVGAP